jgi:hypothetical protein
MRKGYQQINGADHDVACSSPNGLLSLSFGGSVESRCDALLVASSITALRLVVLWVADLGGSENGLCSLAGESTMRVAAAESRMVDPDTEGDLVESASAASLGDRLAFTFFTLPTRTTIARAGVAVAVLALLRKVEPTLKVLLAGLGGRRPLYFW